MASREIWKSFSLDIFFSVKEKYRKYWGGGEGSLKKSLEHSECICPPGRSTGNIIIFSMVASQPYYHTRAGSASASLPTTMSKEKSERGVSLASQHIILDSISIF